ncbi:hemagglutinin repeat-containing protein [Lonsdalea quercina]|uniref:hemagglutinin repeat-containing protein n=1 Tax=Lonsdalea quercina TaxID=71657 RepID=UPI0039769A68
MNKHCYRLIFSRTHGELRVVSELARSCSSEPGQTRGPGAVRLWVTVRRAVWMLGLALFASPALAAGIVADSGAAAGQRPDVIATQNGLPQVNITAPNQAGISHNQYSQFDVDQKGAILNNSAAMTSTQMAGMIQGNPNLNAGSASAKVILNEVNSSNPSQLRGYMEVAGGRAQVIVANPSGIVCDGCGTINAGRMTLTTGKPQLNADGSLAGYQVERGVVRIEGGGLNGDARHDTEYVDVLARAVEVNAGVWAKEKVNVVAGRNRVSADGETVVPSAASDEAKPELAIDMGQMGGMYSGQIHMIGTEAGVGVRNQGGQLQAGKTLTVSSEGRLVWQPAQQEAVTQAGESISLTANNDIEHDGKLHSGGTLKVQSRAGSIKQSGTLAAAGDVQLSAAAGIENTGHLLAGSDTSSTLINEADLTLTSQGEVRSSGSLLSQKNVALTGKRVDIGQAQLAARQATVTAQSGGVGLQQAKVDAQQFTVDTSGDIDARQAQVKAGTWAVDGNTMSNQQAVWVQADTGESRFTLNGALDNTSGNIEANNLSLFTGALDNQNGRLVSLDNNAREWHVGGLLDNSAGELGSNGDLTFNVGTLKNQAGSVKSQQALRMNSAGDVDNTRGTLLAGTALSLDAGQFDNHSGVLGGEQLQLTAQSLNNALGQVISQQDLQLIAHQGLDNQQGFIGAGQDLAIQTEGDWNNQGGTAQSETLISATANNIKNDSGKLLSGDHLSLNAAGGVNNQAGEISATTVELGATHFANEKGKVIGQRSLAVNAAQALNNAQGLLSSGEKLVLHTDGLLTNRDGEANGAELNVTAGQLDNAQGHVIAGQNLNLHVQGGVDNTAGLLEAAETLEVQTEGDWNNQEGTAQGGGRVVATARHLDNTQGRLQSGGALSLNTAADVINQSGKLTAQDDLNWRGASTSLLNNDSGSLQSGGDLVLNGGRLSNRQQGVVLGQQALSFDLSSDWDNQGGQLTSQGPAVLRAANLYNAQGTVNALGSLDMQLTETLDNGSGRIFSQSSQTLTAQEILNDQGWMGTQGEWRADAARFDNTKGSVQSQQGAQLTADALANAEGGLQSAADMTLRVAGDIDNRAGKVSAQHQLTVRGNTADDDTGTVNNAGGQWLAGEGLSLAAQRLDNTQGGLLYSQKQLDLNVGTQIDNQQGKLQSGETLTIQAQSLQNNGGTIDSQQQMLLSTSGELSNQGGALRSNGDQRIAANRVNNQQGVISSQSGLTINAPQLDNAGGTLISQGVGTYHVDTLNNSQGKLHSGNALTLAGSQVNNQAGQLVSTQDFVLNAAQLNNNGQGTISSQGALDIQSDTLNNRDGGLIIGTTRTGVNARAADNTAGRLQSAGAMTLTGLTQLDNTQGRVIANGPLSINALSSRLTRAASALSVLNPNGLMQSGASLVLDALSLNNQGGTLQSQQALSLSVQQDYTHRAGDTLSSNGALTFSVAGVLTNMTDWLLPGDLTLNSAHFSNQGTLVGKSMQVTTGQLTNRGRIEADAMTLDFDTLDNPNAVMGDNLTLRGRVIDNYGSGAVLAATQSLNLRGNERLTNRDGALIFSGGSLQLGSHDLIENRASAIEADGNVTVDAQRLVNERVGLNIERDAESSNYKWQRYNYFWRSYDLTVNTDKNTVAPVTQSLTFQNEAAAQSNPYGTILAIDAAGKRAQVRVKNTSGTLTDMWVNYLALQPNTDGSYAMTFYQTTGYWQRAVPTPYQNTVWREFNRGRLEQWDPEKHIDIYSAPNVTDYNNLRERTVTGSLTRDRLIAEGTGARILAGGDMTLRINGSLLNDASVITANGNLGIEGGGNVDNRGYSVNEHRTEVIADHYDRDTRHWYPTTNYDATTALTTIDGIISGQGKVAITAANMTNTTVDQAQISSVEAALKAAEAERAEWERNPLAFSVEGVDGQQANVALDPGGKATAGSPSGLGRPLLPAEVALTAKQYVGSVATSIPDNGLFRQNPATGSPYLVVTDERFTSRTQFVSSDYLLSQVGYDPSTVHKRLGDGFYEQRLVRDQVLSLTGRQSVQGEDAMAQYQNLMNNGIKVAQDFHLVTGVALTPEQIASLQQDIVWMVDETVETASGPQTVLVPKVYLAQSTLRLTGDGALIAGGELDLSADSIANAGNLFADKALSIDAGQFSHLSGDIKADSINVQAESLTMSTNLQDALRQATLSASDISLSGNDIHLQGAKLDATNNLSLSARDNLDISAAKSSFKSDGLEVISGAMGNRTSDGMEEAGERMATLSGEWQQALGSELKAGGNLSLKAGQDITLRGSQASAGGQLGVQAGGDINLLADKSTNTTHLEANSSTSSVSNSREEDRLLLSAMSGAKGVTLIAGKDLLAEGAQVDSTEGRVGVSADNITIKEAHQLTNAFDSEDKQDGRTKSQRMIDSASDAVVGSTFSGQGGVTAIAREGDLAVTGSTLHSELGEIALQAKNDVAINSATEKESEHLEERSQKKGFLNKSASTTVQDDSFTTERGSLLSGNSVSVNSGNDLGVKGSSVVAQGDVRLKAVNDVTIEAATETSSSLSIKESKKSGVLSNNLGITIGSQSSKASREGSEVTQSEARSLIGTSGGNVIINAGNKATVSASDVTAARKEGDAERKTGHIDITASDIDIIPGKDVVQETAKQSSNSKGVGISLSDPLVEAVRNIKAINKENDSGVTKAKQLSSELAAAAADIGGGASLPISYGRSSSKSESQYYAAFSSGSNLTAAGNIQLNATGEKGQGNVLISGSRLGAEESIIIDAKNSVDITTSTDQENLSTRTASSAWSVTSAAPTVGSGTRTMNGGPNHGSGVLPFGMEKSSSEGERQTIAQSGSQMAGNDIFITSKDGHINLEGSTLASINNLLLSAESGGINITTGTNTISDRQDGKESMVGSLGGDGYSGKVGYRSSKHSSQLNSNQQSTLHSQITSQQGNIALQAKQDVSVDGADIRAGKSLLLSGDNIHLDVSEDSLHNSSKSSSSQYGVTASASGWAVSAAKALENAARSKEEGRDSRLTAIYAAQAALTTATGVAQEAYNGSLVKVTVGVSAGSSKEQQDYRSQEEQGTHLVAGETVRLDADKDIVGRGVSIVGNNVAMDAGRDITLSSAQDTEKEQSRSSGNQFSLGVGFSLIGQQNGFSIEIGASRSRSQMEGHSLVNHNSEVQATDTLTMNSDRDTTLQGAELYGERVVADVGRDLTISSQQDSAEYHSRSNSTGLNLSICVPPICAGASSASSAQGSMDISSGRINNEYRAVIDQSGVFAGKGGFDIFVGNHTQLDGAVIASDAEAAKNRLSTDTLGWSDIENWAESSGSQYALSVSGGVGKSTDSGGVVATTGESQTGGYQGSSGGKPSMSMANFTQRVTSTTHSAVAEGDVMVRDSANQQQDVATLSRDTEHAHSVLDNNFDRDGIRDKLEIQQQATALGTQAMTAYAESKQDAAKQQARDEMAASGELDGLSETEIEQRVLGSATFKAAESEYGVGSPFWTAGTSVSGLLAGALGGNVQSGAAAGAAPVLAKLIKDASGDKEGARIALHTLASAVLAKAQGGNATAGAAGGFIAAASAKTLALAIYGKEAGELAPDEKMVILNLVSALGAAGGGLATGDTSGIVSAGNAARVEVENNALSVKENQSRAQEMSSCGSDRACKDGVTEKYKQISAEQQKSVVECTGAQNCVDKANEVSKLQADYANRTNELLEKARATGGLNPEEQNELSILQVTTIQLEADRNAAIHNALMSGDSPEAKQLAINSLAQAVGTSAAGIAAGVGKGKYQPNQGAVGNMNELLRQPGFGSEIKNSAQKSSQQYQGQSVYKATGDVGEYIKKGDQFYLDGQHKDHLEVFDKRGNFRAVLNLDGSLNEAKTKAAEGRKFK